MHFAILDLDEKSDDHGKYIVSIFHEESFRNCLEK